MKHLVSDNVLLGIFVGYLIVAGYLFAGAFRHHIPKRKRTARAALATIFVLCGYAGYGSEVYPGFAAVAHYVLLAVLIGLIVVMATGTDIFGDKK